MTTKSEIYKFIDSIDNPYQLMIMDRYIKEALIKLGVSKSKGNPVGEYAEYLAAKALHGERMKNTKEGHDVTLVDGNRVEVKGRVFEGTRVPMTYIKHSTIKQETFDYLVYIVLSQDMRVRYAMQISHTNFKNIAKYTEPKNTPPKWVFVAKNELLNDSRVKDITNIIRSAANEKHS